METKLSEMKPGMSGCITRVKGEGNARRRMMELGLLPGATVRVDRRGPFYGPLSIQTRGYYLALRKREAEDVYVEVSNECRKP